MVTKTAERPELLTLNELADYLRIGRRTAWQLVTDGTVPAVKVGGQWRILRAEVDAQLGRRAPEMRSPGLAGHEGERSTEQHGQSTA
jgi:excisionase family DNA binding protein